MQYPYLGLDLFKNTHATFIEVAGVSLWCCSLLFAFFLMSISSLQRNDSFQEATLFHHGHILSIKPKVGGHLSSFCIFPILNWPNTISSSLSNLPQKALLHFQAAQRIGSRLSPHFAFHTCTTQQQTEISTVFRTFCWLCTTGPGGESPPKLQRLSFRHLY